MPSARQSTLGSHARSLARTDRALLDEFETLDPDTQREAARWLAHQAFEIAGLDRLDWFRPAIDALDRGGPLPDRFADRAAVFSRLHEPGAVRTAIVSVTRGSPNSQGRRIHRPSAGVPALYAALEPDPLRALVDTYSNAVATFDDQHATLLARLHRRLAG